MACTGTACVVMCVLQVGMQWRYREMNQEACINSLWRDMNLTQENSKIFNFLPTYVCQTKEIHLHILHPDGSINGYTHAASKQRWCHLKFQLKEFDTPTFWQQLPSENIYVVGHSNQTTHLAKNSFSRVRNSVPTKQSYRILAATTSYTNKELVSLATATILTFSLQSEVSEGVTKFYYFDLQ